MDAIIALSIIVGGVGQTVPVVLSGPVLLAAQSGPSGTMSTTDSSTVGPPEPYTECIDTTEEGKPGSGDVKVRGVLRDGWPLRPCDPKTSPREQQGEYDNSRLP